MASLIVHDIRLPRTVCCAAGGGGTLGLSGAVLPGLTRNPLAEPGLLWCLSGRGAWGAVLAIYFGRNRISLSRSFMDCWARLGRVASLTLRWGQGGTSALILAGAGGLQPRRCRHRAGPQFAPIFMPL